MKISYNWLSDYVDIKLKPKELARWLTMAGLEVVSIEEKKGDTIFELEITPNRPDCLSLVGVAREVGAITGGKIKYSVQRSASNGSTSSPSLVEPSRAKPRDLKLKIEDKRDCPRYTGRLMAGVKIAPSPRWLQDKLISVGLRPVNNVVDISNFVLMETGHPLHAFDADKLKEEVIIRRPKKGEIITTIDGVKRNLDENILVIADKQKPVAVAGVMGGLETEVNQNSKNIFLESAYFNPVVVRRGARQLGLSTESSYRFERGVDLETVLTASNRATSLIIQLAGGKAGKIQDVGTKKVLTKSITLRQDRLNSILGTDLSIQRTRNILNSLQLKSSIGRKETLTVKIPSFRRDLVKEIDLIEEAARIFGYENIPLTLPLEAMSLKEPFLIKDHNLKRIEDLTKETLLALGLNEIITYSLISRDLLIKSGLTGGNIVSIHNPLSREQEIMRPSLIPSLFSVASYNLNHKNNNLKLFELGKIYFSTSRGDNQEKVYLSLALAGEDTAYWQNKPKNFDFFSLKGIINTLLEKLGAKELTWSSQTLPYFVSGQSAQVAIEGKTIGVLGKVNEKTLNNFDIKTNLYIAELNFADIAGKTNLKKYFSRWPKYPSITRDLSLIAEKDISAGEIEKLIRKVGSSLVKEIKLTDLYFGQPIPAGHKGLLYSIEYQTPQRTLTDQEVNDLHQKITCALAQEFKITVR